MRLIQLNKTKDITKQTEFLVEERCIDKYQIYKKLLDFIFVSDISDTVCFDIMQGLICTTKYSSYFHRGENYRSNIFCLTNCTVTFSFGQLENPELAQRKATKLGLMLNCPFQFSLVTEQKPQHFQLMVELLNRLTFTLRNESNQKITPSLCIA